MKDIRTRLHETFRKDLLSHAYILEGGDMRSRQNLAMDLAIHLLCRHRDQMSHGMPCMECTSCKKAMAEEHPDLLVIKPEKGLIRLDAVKQLVSALKYPPFESDMRTVVIMEGDKMNPEAANTLLKTLEEPPPRNCFFITTPSRNLLLSTICSRCQTLTLAGEEPSLFAQVETGKERFLLLLKDLDVSGTEEQDTEHVLSIREELFRGLWLYHKDKNKAMAAACAFTMARNASKDPFIFSVVIQYFKSMSRDLMLMAGHGDDSSLQGLLINEDHLDLMRILITCFDEVELFEHIFRLQELENMVRRGINLEYAVNSVILFWLGETWTRS